VQLLTSTADRQQLRIAVQDNGIGIAEAVQARIFERFVQADEQVARRYGGAGLGLAICKRLVQAMGGQIELHSREGEGSCFWFDLWLPVVSDLPLLPQVPRREAISLHVLVVEDVELNRQVAQGLLERDGHRVTLAEDAEPALQLCRQQRFDLILLDVHLPGFSGVELCRRLRRDLQGLNRATPIFAFTASLQASKVQRYLEAGMQGVIGKPMRLAELYQALDGIPQAVPQEDAAALLDARVLQAHGQMLGSAKLAELLGLLRCSLDEQGAALLKAVDEENAAAIGALAHRLASASESLGGVALARQLQRLEALAEAGELAQCAAQRQALGERLSATAQAISQAVRGLADL
jgi:CheY-like chemotaxis protein